MWTALLDWCGLGGGRQSRRSPLLATAPHPGRALRLRSRPLSWGVAEKMVIVVRKDLGMRSGRLAAQAAHAAVELTRTHCTRPNGTCNRWYNTGAHKVVLRVDGEKELERIAANARKRGLPVAVVSDSKDNQARKTALSILGDSHKVDEITGALRLL